MNRGTGTVESTLRPDTPVRFLKGVGPARAALLEREGIATVEDLLRAPPRGYLDRRTMRPIEGLLLGEAATDPRPVPTGALGPDGFGHGIARGCG